MKGCLVSDIFSGLAYFVGVLTFCVCVLLVVARLVNVKDKGDWDY